MSDFKVKMHQIRFRLGLRPKPHLGSLQCSARPLAGFKGPTSKGGRERKGVGRGRKDKEKERGGGSKGNGGESIPLALILQFDHCVKHQLTNKL